ncbi:hypothetical protein DL96DRAFT_1825620 [Flagelloscypha sp. PMI_526]|nr:hypothetical protein DL96DRAFT_1825620 [Flagelloscypha sp. PMI_526]
MTTLPLEVCNEIISSLDIPALNSCSLVNRDFRRITQQYEFKHIVLDAKTWKAKCRFLLSEQGLRFRRKARELTLSLENMTLLFGSEEQAAVEMLELSSVIREIGPQLTTFRIEGLVPQEEEEDADEQDADEEDEEDYTKWPNISPWFRSQLFAHIIPFVKTLEFVGVGILPLSKIINEARHLQNLYFRSDVGIGDDEEEDRTFQAGSETADLHLTLGSFSVRDFDPYRSLGFFMKIAGKQISTLELQTPIRVYLPSLYILYPQETLRTHLRHLVFGKELHKTIIDCSRAADHKLCPFWWFRSLEALTLHTAVSRPSDWPWWFEWISLSLQSGYDIHILETLRTLEFVVAAEGVCDIDVFHGEPFNFNTLTECSSFTVEFFVASSDGIVKTKQFFTFIRSFLWSWEVAERLTFRVDLNR